MKKGILLGWVFWGLFQLGYAQEKKDYLLTLQQDTLYGKILTESYGSAPITFIYGKNKMIYQPSSIQFFGIYRDKNYRHFKSLTSEGGKSIFVQIMVNGPIKLYKYSEEHIHINTTQKRYVYFFGSADRSHGIRSKQG